MCGPEKTLWDRFLCKTLLSSMAVALKVATVFLVSVDMATSLAHALEFPGKLRLDERTYLAVQTIYYRVLRWLESRRSSLSLRR